jgi:hypothetical protein
VTQIVGKLHYLIKGRARSMPPSIAPDGRRPLHGRLVQNQRSEQRTRRSHTTSALGGAVEFNPTEAANWKC